MISSGLYWLTSNLSFSSFSSPDCSAIKGDFSPCIDCVCNDNSSQSYFYFSIIDPSLVQLQCAVNCISWRNTILWKWDLQPGRMSSHGPCDPWQHLRVTICVTEINILVFRHNFSPRRGHRPSKVLLSHLQELLRAFHNRDGPAGCGPFHDGDAWFL